MEADPHEMAFLIDTGIYEKYDEVIMLFFGFYHRKKPH